MITAILAAALAAMPATAADNADAKAKITAYITSCETAWAMTVVQPDPAAIEQCIADDYRGFSSTGGLATKSSLLKPEGSPAKAAGLYYAKPRYLAPTIAVVQGEEWWEPKDGTGKRHLIWTDTWMMRNGRWQIVASQDSVVPFDQPLLN